MALNLFFPPEIENIFFVILLPNTKAIVAGTIYRPPIQSEFFGNYKNSLTWRFFQNKKNKKQKKNKTKQNYFTDNRLLVTSKNTIKKNTMYNCWT